MTSKHFHKISNVLADSIADEMGIERGDELISIDGEEIEDIFDYRFMIQSEELLVLIRKMDGEEWELEIEKDEDEDLGIEFEQSLMDEYRSCRNKCVFCFIDQMPPDMRPTLYFKDDDSRLSFLQGNYVTLTNMSDHDIDRIIRFHLEPINISVHASNPELRCKMLNNRFAGESLGKLKRLYDAGIIMNGQIVLCKNLNDQEELTRTLNDLLEYAPCMQSVSVVPVGLTKYRDNLYPLEELSREDALDALARIEAVQKKALERYGTRFVHASDEMYILAEREFPTEDEYEGYMQLENGVGMLRLLIDEYDEAYQQLSKDIKAGIINPSSIDKKFSIATGRLAYPFVKESVNKLISLFENSKANIYPIRNDFFGEKITVTGLITGRDLISQLQGQELGEVLLINECMLRFGEEVFLDDITISDVEKTLQVKTHIIKSSVSSFVNFILS